MLTEIKAQNRNRFAAVEIKEFSRKYDVGETHS